MEFTDEELYAWVADPDPPTAPEPEHGALGPASAYGALDRAVAAAAAHETCDAAPSAFCAVLRLGGHDGWTVVQAVPQDASLFCVLQELDADPEVITVQMLGWQFPDPPLPDFPRHTTLHDDVIVESFVPGLTATWHPEPEPEPAPRHLRPRRRRCWTRAH